MGGMREMRGVRGMREMRGVRGMRHGRDEEHERAEAWGRVRGRRHEGMRGTRHDVSLGSRFGVCVRDLLRRSCSKH